MGHPRETTLMPRRFALLLTLASLLLLPCGARAGLYYSGETYASLPSQWRGFLLDHRALRNIAVNPLPGQDAAPMRVKYQKEARKLQERLDRDKKLPADAWADLGA